VEQGGPGGKHQAGVVTRMKRRAFITLLAGAGTWPLASRAQQQPAKLARVGFLRAAGPDDKDFNAFRSGLRALGYVEGQNIVIEQRCAAGSYDRVGELAAELVRLNVDVIVVDGPAAAKPAKAATADIPIVFTLATDPVADGLVSSMARPGGNLTGLTLSVGYELVAKRVELLKDIKLDLARLAILRNPANPSAGFLFERGRKGRQSPQPYDADVRCSEPERSRSRLRCDDRMACRRRGHSQ